MVAALSLAPLTVAGHYSANLLRGANANPLTAMSVFWLALFYAVGLLMALVALSAISGSTRHLAVRPVIGLSLSLVGATFDWWTLTDTPTALALNLAAASVTALVLGEVARLRRGGTIPPTLGSRVLDWAAGTLLIAAPLTFVLPHPATVDGVGGDCPPVWLVIRTRCLGATDAWWPLGLGLGIIGGVLWSLGRGGVAFAPGRSRRRSPETRRQPRPTRPAVPANGRRSRGPEVIDLTTTDSTPAAPPTGKRLDATTPPTGKRLNGTTPQMGRRLGELEAVPPPRPRARSTTRNRPEDRSR